MPYAFVAIWASTFFQLPFSWKSLDVDICGRSSTLRVNYRTSHQMRSQADKLLDTELTDADDNMENATTQLPPSTARRRKFASLADRKKRER
jgi:hypothetical protein